MARSGPKRQEPVDASAGTQGYAKSLRFRYVIVHSRTEADEGGVGSRRDALLRGMIDAVGENGYRDVSVADALAEAGVSRTTFYKHFEDKLDCYLAAYDAAASEVVAAIEAGCDPELPWPDRVRGALGRALDLFVADPHLARAGVVEIAAAGPAGQSRRAAMLDRLAGLLERGDAPADPELPPNTATMAAGAALGLVFEEIEAGRTAELAERLPDLLFAVLVPYLGPGAASAEAHPPLSPAP